MEGLSLDEKLLLDKRSLSVPYGEINKLEVMKSRFGGRRFLVNGNTSEQHGFGIEKPEDYENLCVLLPQIPALVGKLEFSGK